MIQSLLPMLSPIAARGAPAALGNSEAFTNVDNATITDNGDGTYKVINATAARSMAYSGPLSGDVVIELDKIAGSVFVALDDAIPTMGGGYTQFLLSCQDDPGGLYFYYPGGTYVAPVEARNGRVFIERLSNGDINFYTGNSWAERVLERSTTTVTTDVYGVIYPYSTAAGDGGNVRFVQRP